MIMTVYILMRMRIRLPGRILSDSTVMQSRGTVNREVGARERFRGFCSYVVTWALHSLSLSHDESGDSWKEFAFSPVRHKYCI